MIKILKEFFSSFTFERILAVFALKALFDNDSSKIVSERGQEVLNDPKLLKQIEEYNKKRLNDYNSKYNRNKQFNYKK